MSKKNLNTKHEILNKSETQNSKYDLEDRTLVFAKNCRAFVKQLPRNTANIEDGKQLVRSSGSVGANYIEANESLSKRDFTMRIKICRKEAKESSYWLRVIESGSKLQEKLLRESVELMKIFGAILEKSK